MRSPFRRRLTADLLAAQRDTVQAQQALTDTRQDAAQQLPDLEDELGKLPPPAPRNVRVIAGDVIYPVELTYEGQDREGLHIWLAVTTVALPAGARGVLVVDTLPGRTTIRVGVR